MIDKIFPGTLIKHTHFYEENDVFVKFSIKHTSEGDVQSFIDSFEQKIANDSIKSLFNYPIRWKKIVIDTTDYEKCHMNVSFDEVDFDCDLTEIAVSRKIKNGAESFEYVLTFSKDVGLQNEDSAFVKTYLKYKEEDENGKKKIVEFDVNLTVIPITRTGSDSAELF